MVFVIEFGFFVCDIGLRFKFCLLGILILLRLIVNCKCLWFLCIILEGFWMIYDGGVGFFVMIFLGIFFVDLILYELSYLVLGCEGVVV